MPYNLHNGKSTGECNRKIIRKYISIVEKTLIICCHMIKSSPMPNEQCVFAVVKYACQQKFASTHCLDIRLKPNYDI